MVITALFIAIGIVLPLAFHTVPNAGRVFLPIHIPVFMCGLVCGFPYGLLCGLIVPPLASLFTGMPPLPILPAMIFELAAYGAATGLLISYLPVKNLYIKIYVSLVASMLFGRVFFGIMNALLFSAGSYSFGAWLTAAFVTALPGIVVQIVVIPVVIVALSKTKLVEIK